MARLPPPQLNIILDIDNTLVEYMGVKDSPWPALPDEEKKKYAYYQGFVLRPELWDFFAWMKKLARTVNLWTLSDQPYAEWVKEIIEERMGEGFITNVWSEDHDGEAKGHPVPGGRHQKNLYWIWDQEKYKKQGFLPCNTILIDDYLNNVNNTANYRNAIKIKKFALWSRVVKSDPFGPYTDMSEDRGLLDVVDELKKIDQSRLCGGSPLPAVEGASDATPLALAMPGSGGRRRRSTRKFKRYGSRRYGSRRRSGGVRS